MSNDRDLETLRRALRAKLRDGAPDVTLSMAELRRLLDELGRLQQSNDRLRRQNRRARLKLQRAGLDDGATDDASDDTAGDGEPEQP